MYIVAITLRFNTKQVMQRNAHGDRLLTTLVAAQPCTVKYTTHPKRRVSGIHGGVDSCIYRLQSTWAQQQ